MNSTNRVARQYTVRRRHRPRGGGGVRPRNAMKSIVVGTQYRRGSFDRSRNRRTGGRSVFSAMRACLMIPNEIQLNR